MITKTFLYIISVTHLHLRLRLMRWIKLLRLRVQSIHVLLIGLVWLGHILNLIKRLGLLGHSKLIEPILEVIIAAMIVTLGHIIVVLVLSLRLVTSK